MNYLLAAFVIAATGAAVVYIFRQPLGLTSLWHLFQLRRAMSKVNQLLAQCQAEQQPVDRKDRRRRYGRAAARKHRTALRIHRVEKDLIDQHKRLVAMAQDIIAHGPFLVRRLGCLVAGVDRPGQAKEVADSNDLARTRPAVADSREPAQARGKAAVLTARGRNG